jgi:hypothetical protein
VTRVRMTADTAVALVKLHSVIGMVLGLSTITVDAPDPAVKPNGSEIGSSKGNPLTFEFNSGSNDLPQSQTAGNSTQNLGLAQISPTKVTVLGLPVQSLNSVVNSVLNNIDGLTNAMLAPVLTSLGFRLGTVEIQPTTRPSCNDVALRD